MRLPSPDFESEPTKLRQHLNCAGNALTATGYIGRHVCFALDPSRAQIASTAPLNAPCFCQTGTTPDCVPEGAQGRRSWTSETPALPRRIRPGVFLHSPSSVIANANGYSASQEPCYTWSMTFEFVAINKRLALGLHNAVGG